MSTPLPTIAVLGASGLIGEVVATFLLQEGFPVVPIARRYSEAQNATFGAAAVERPIVALDAAALAQIFDEHKIDIVVNCVGVLQDGPRGNTDVVHRAFIERIVTVLGSFQEPRLLIQISIPGDSVDDRTSFSRTKRDGERAIAVSSVPFVILRPGFVVAQSAYGSSALIRALAMLPFNLPKREAERPFATTDVADIGRTISFVAHRWADGERSWNAVWELMTRDPTTVGGVIESFRRRLGGPTSWMALPLPLLVVGAKAGDLVSYLGWSPPIRSTALAEMRRGVVGDPAPWIAATEIEPISLAASLRRITVDVQEKWFARLYLVKALILTSLVVFWVASGLIALTVAFGAATSILSAHGFPPLFAEAVTVVSSLMDIFVGCLIAVRKTCRIGLIAGIGVSLFYMAGATVLTPELWVEPLGALVKTLPAIALMLVALAIWEDR
jgi:uncharacterized protein YbjT (DUF2867 family)